MLCYAAKISEVPQYAHLGIVLPGAASWAAALSGYFFWLTWQCKRKTLLSSCLWLRSHSALDFLMLCSRSRCASVLAPFLLILIYSTQQFFFIYISFWSSSLSAILLLFQILFLFSFDFLHYLLIILFKPNFWFLLHFPLKITQAILLSFPQKPSPIFCTSLFTPFKELVQSHLLINFLTFWSANWFSAFRI